MKMVSLSNVLAKSSTIKWCDHSDDAEFEYIDLSSVERNSHTITETTTITAKTAPSRAQKIVKENDVLFGTTRPTLNRLCVVPMEYNSQICSTGLCVLRADQEKIMPSYIYYLLTTPSFVEYVKATQRGTSYPAVTDSDVKRFEFVLPPLQEQRRVVERLDAAFEKIDRAIELTEKNIESNKDLFEKLVEEEIKKTDASKSVDMEMVCGFVRGPFGGSLKKEFFKPVGFAVYEQRHAIYGDFKQVRYHIGEKKFHEMIRFEIQPGDVIMSCSGTMGKTSIVPITAERGIINQALLKLSPDPQKLLSEYLKYWMESNKFQVLIGLNSGGSAIKNVASVKILKLLPINLPRIEEQRSIVKAIKELKLKDESLRHSYGAKLKALRTLKQSMLTQAFSESDVK